jgi:hypothetical protein
MILSIQTDGLFILDKLWKDTDPHVKTLEELEHEKNHDNIPDMEDPEHRDSRL